MRFLVAFCRLSAALTAILMIQSNSSNGQDGPSSLVVLVLLKLLQSRTEKLYLLLRRRHKKYSPLQVLILLHHVQDIRIHCPSDCWLISCFFSVAHLINTPMPIHSQHSSSKANRKAESRSRRHHRRLSCCHVNIRDTSSCK
ncbi:hypothetical protein BDR03DRAFT_974678 [Suillus americanus]|nr:hypothetical protein BDR03DRAFT_974678 [Suillus americanus]